MNLMQLLAQMGGNPTLKRVSNWKTNELLATADDVVFGLTPGVKYTIWVAQKDFSTRSGSPVKQGEWFAVEKA